MKKHENTRKNSRTIAIAAAMMAGSILTACAAKGAPAAQEYVSAGADTAQNSAQEASGSDIGMSTKSISLSDAEKLRAGRMIQEDDNDIYICANGMIQRYDKNDLSACTKMYQQQSDGDAITGFCVNDANLYVLTTNDSSDTSLILVNAEGKEQNLKKFSNTYIAQVAVYNKVLHLTHEDAGASGMEDEAYALQADGTLGDADTKVQELIKKLPSEDYPLTVYNDTTTYFDAAYCMAVYGKIYRMDGSGKLVVADPADQASLAKPKVIAASIPGCLYGMTQKYALSIDSSSSDGWKCYLTDLADGTQKQFAVIRDAAGYTQVLGYDEDGIYVSVSTAEAGTDSQMVYHTMYYSYLDGSATEMYRLKSEASTDITAGIFAGGSYGILKNGICYVRSSDYNNVVFMRSYADPQKETKLGGNPFFESGLKEAGITLNQSEYTKYADDTDKQAVLHVKSTIPVFSGNAGADQVMNTLFSDNEKKAEEAMLKDAQDCYKDYAAMQAKSADSAAKSTTDATMDYSGLPYEFYNMVMGLTYCDDQLLCLKITEYDYTGGAHGSTVDSYYVMDRKTGQRLVLGDVVDLGSTDFKSLVVKYLKEKISKNPEMFFEGAAKSIENGYQKNEFNFYLTKEGIGVEFGQYEIAPYAAGMQNIIIPYNELKMKVDVNVGES